MAEETPPGTTASAANPVEVPAKFKNQDGTANVDAILKSYTELEKKVGKPPETVAPVEPKPDAKPNPLSIKQEPIAGDLLTFETVLKKVGVDPTELAKSWTETGDLTPQQRKAFNRNGYGDDIARTIVKGQYAAAKLEAMETEQAYKSGMEVVGGEQQLKTLIDWYNANADADDVADLDKMVKENPKRFTRAVEIMNLAYTKKNGEKSNLVSGDTAVNTGKGATSLKDYREALRRGDQASRDKVVATTQAQIDEWMRA